METSALVQSAPDRYTRVASWTHTIALLAVLGGWALLAKMLAEQMRAASNPNRVRAYAVTTLMEWLVFGFVVWGVRRSGASVLLVVGERWRSARRVLRDLGVAAGFWVVAVALLWVFSKLLGIDSEGRNMQFILPHGGVEIAVWIVLSVTAGICEETIFRGYRVSGLAAGGFDQPVRRDVRNSRVLARECSPGNDGACVAGFTGRDHCGAGEALARRGVWTYAGASPSPHAHRGTDLSLLCTLYSKR